MSDNSCSVVVLISGNGSNLQAIIEYSKQAKFDVVGVISNRPDAYGLQRAAHYQIPTSVIRHQDYPERELFDQMLKEKIESYQPGLIVLAGFMRILSTEFVEHFRGKILNIHPSLLPHYPGTNTHQRVLDAGEKAHGASVHFVTEELDGGPVVGHSMISIDVEDNAESLARRVASKEHILYPKILNWFAQGRLSMENGKAVLDGEVLSDGGVCIS